VRSNGESDQKQEETEEGLFILFIPSFILLTGPARDLSVGPKLGISASKIAVDRAGSPFYQYVPVCVLAMGTLAGCLVHPPLGLTGTRGLRTRIGAQGLPSAFINSGT
jgi:hypothetical protein